MILSHNIIEKVIFVQFTFLKFYQKGATLTLPQIFQINQKHSIRGNIDIFFIQPLSCTHILINDQMIHCTSWSYQIHFRLLHLIIIRQNKLIQINQIVKAIF